MLVCQAAHRQNGISFYRLYIKGAAAVKMILAMAAARFAMVALSRYFGIG
jgi:hypothetical protein